MTSVQERIKEIELHLFRDASIIGTSTVAYAVTQETSSKTQGIISSKSRLSKKNTSIPRLDLIATVMVANLAENITNSLQRFKVTVVHGWSNSMVVLHWVKGNGTCRQFVKNRIDHINSKAPIQWHYVSTDENPADIGSRGCNVNTLPKKWLEGPTWLQSKEEWLQRGIEPTKESQEEAKLLKEVFYAAKLDESQVDVFIKFEFWQTIRILSHKTKSKEKQVGPLKTDEINKSIKM